MGLREEYQKKVEIQLDELGSPVQKLAARTEGIKKETRMEYRKRLETVKEKQKIARKKFEELGKASGAAWKDLLWHGQRLGGPHGGIAACGGQVQVNGGSA